MQSEKELYFKYIEKKGLKNTEQRLQILETFLAMPGHFTAFDLHAIVKRKNPQIGISTVFRTVKLLEECGLAKSVKISEEEKSYEYNPTHHHHLVCSECHATIEFIHPTLERIVEEIPLEYGFIASKHKLEIQGVCENCQKGAKVEKAGARIQENISKVFERDVLRIFIHTEKRGINFYNSHLNDFKEDWSRRLFSALAEEEKHHLQLLQRQYQRLLDENRWLEQQPRFFIFDYDEVAGAFKRSLESFKKSLTSVDSEMRTLQEACFMEKENHEFFKNMAEKLDDVGKRLCEEFAEEEKHHMQVIQLAIDNLERVRSDPTQRAAFIHQLEHEISQLK
ncbi:MAG TPA: transcriptional repressor [Acidobacteriota bacterium]|jgi:Fur family ferric uptake transcriptional regulator|nr:transcriptional repressor [Acidobacteriota bacterium]